MPGAYLLNQITASIGVYPSSIDSAYPTANLYGEHSAQVFRCTSKTSLAIIIDFGAAVSLNAVALVNHNLTSQAQLTLLDGASSPASNVIANPACRALDLWKGFPTTTNRYWILQITDNNPSNIQIGQLLLGLSVALPRARKIGNYKPGIANANISSETYGGSKYSYPLNRRLTFNPAFRVLGSELNTLQGLHDAVIGDVHPFLYIPDTTQQDCFYVRKEAGFDPTEFDTSVSSQSVYDYTMTLTEESRGLEILS